MVQNLRKNRHRVGSITYFRLFRNHNTCNTPQRFVQVHKFQ